MAAQEKAKLTAWQQAFSRIPHKSFLQSVQGGSTTQRTVRLDDTITATPTLPSVRAESPLPAQISKLRHAPCPSPNSGPGVTMRTYNTSTSATTHAPTVPDANASGKYIHSAPVL